MVLGGGGLKKVGPEIQIAMGGHHYKKDDRDTPKKEYKDKFPKKGDVSTEAKLRKKYGTLVWCKYLKCGSNTVIPGLQRTTGTILKNSRYKPIAEQEHIWEGICTRGEIALKYDEIISTGKNKYKIPHCFTSSVKSSGHVDFTKFLNPDGSALGGNIDSQHVSDDGMGVFDSNSMYE